MLVFVYGSLLHPDGLEEQFGNSIKLEKAVLTGFKRHYGQLSDIRTDETGEYGNVLTVTEKEGYYCNGILVSGVTDQQFSELKERESGYSLERITTDKIKIRGEGIESDYFYVSVGERQTHQWNPLKNYMETCDNGAREWSRKFHSTFRKTTYKFADSEERPHL